MNGTTVDDNLRRYANPQLLLAGYWEVARVIRGRSIFKVHNIRSRVLSDPSSASRQCMNVVWSWHSATKMYIESMLAYNTNAI